MTTPCHLGCRRILIFLAGKFSICPHTLPPTSRAMFFGKSSAPVIVRLREGSPGGNCGNVSPLVRGCAETQNSSVWWIPSVTNVSQISPGWNGSGGHAPVIRGIW